MSTSTPTEGAAMFDCRTEGPRILLYSHDSYGLGHFRRSSSIAQAIAAICPEASLLCVTGSPRPDLFPLPPGADYVKLPSVTKSADGEYVALGLDHHLDAIVHLRAQTIAAVARSYRPDVILIDHTPLGLRSELVPMLEEQRQRGDVHIALGLRDILDEPRRARLEMGQPRVRAALESFYDTIFVYGHQEVCDLAAEYGLGDAVARRLRYVGIACCVEEMAEEWAMNARRELSEPPHVVVTVGGGADGRAVLDPTIDALRHDDGQGALRATVVTGPLLDEAERFSIESRIAGAPDIELIAATSNVHELLADADLVVTMGGYNSIYEALCMRRRVLALPRSHPRKEQLDRVQRLERHGLLTRVGDDVAGDAAAFRAHMRRALERPAPDARKAGLRFGGATRTAQWIVSQAHGRALTDEDDDPNMIRERSA